MNTNHTNHETLRDDLKAYLDNELNPWRRFQVRRHVAGCAECRAEIQYMINTSQKLQTENAAGTDEPAFDAGLRARILNDVPAADRTFDVAPPVVSRRWRPKPSEMAVLGVTSLLLVAIVLPTQFRARENARRSSGQLVAGQRMPAPQSTVRKDERPLSTLFKPGAAGEGDYAAAPPPGAAPEAGTGFADGRVDAFDKKRREGQLDDVSQRAENFKRPSNRSSSTGLAGGSTAEIDTTRRVHREASIGVGVKNAEVASDAVVKMVESAGGFIAGNTLTTGGDDAKNAAMDIRVPVGKFDTVLKQIGELGEVKSKNVSGEDKTEQFSNADQARRILVEDLSLKEAQLRSAQQRAERKKKIYVPGWEERQELRNLRIQAAQAKARLEILRKTTDLSEISVQLQEKATPPGEAGFWQSLNDTKLEAGKSFVGAARIPLACLIWVLAYSPLWLPALLVWKYLNRTPRNAA